MTKGWNICDTRQPNIRTSNIGAYQNWQWRGSPIGSPEVDWFLAEKEYIERGLRMARVQCFSLRLLWAPLNSRLHSNLAPTLGLQTERF
jgi:hypothetical protein